MCMFSFHDRPGLALATGAWCMSFTWSRGVRLRTSKLSNRVAGGSKSSRKATCAFVCICGGVLQDMTVIVAGPSMIECAGDASCLDITCLLLEVLIDVTRGRCGCVVLLPVKDPEGALLPSIHSLVPPAAP